MWAGKKKFVVEIDEKYVEQKNHQVLTYIITDKRESIRQKRYSFLRRNIKKKLSDVDHQRKLLFSRGGKKKSLQATKTKKRVSYRLFVRIQTKTKGG